MALRGSERGDGAEGIGAGRWRRGALLGRSERDHRAEGSGGANGAAARAPGGSRSGTSSRAPRSDWRAVPATRSLLSPIGCSFPPQRRAPPPQLLSPQSNMAAAAAPHGSEPRPGPAGNTSLLSSATTWPLKRYGRFLPPRDGDDEGRNTSWKVLESNEESGALVLTIVVSGHFFISQGRTVLEGFSLIDSHKWLKIVRRADCLLLQAQAKNECRMFRVQFGGASKEEMLGHCCSCVQKLCEYLPVEQSQQLPHRGREHPQAMDTQHAPDEPLPDPCTSFGERSVAQLAQAVLRGRPELPLPYRQVVWPAQELGPFIRLCLLDQHFPAFVQDVEKELQKLTEVPARQRSLLSATQ
ncbi:meiotic recombination protein REC114 [Pithys albifrons albifrons]|uniref:meiotic recombination protein REC114 n=1 Tax=Pithys albifrons albifrons TaxID=3385563 RepID=UPI003A5CCDA7